MSNIDKFLATLPIMAQGMGGIFIVMLVIFLLIYLLNKVTADKTAPAQGGDSDSESHVRS